MKIIVSGATGRVGQEIIKLVSESKNSKIVAEIDSKTNLQNLNYKGANVVLDFSSPNLTQQLLKCCLSYKLPIVSGTTGLDKKDFVKASKKIPILWAPNMSLGVYVLNQMLKNFKTLKQYNFEIEETHHVHKKDAPSGTAILIQKNLEKIIGKKVECKSIREGEVFGIHKVRAISPEEVITLKHEALNRTIFARGALACAHKLIKKKPGLYSMEDIFE